jgi:hypothetical protein
MLAFVEAFWIMGVMFLAMLPFILLLRYHKTSAPSSEVITTRQTIQLGRKPTREEVALTR